MKTPYIDNIFNKNHFVRTFDKNVNTNDLVWHRDKRDRIIKVLSGDRWQLQFDNQLPFDLIEDCIYIIPKMIFHRIIKGDLNLILDIHEE